jgi:hypothetical protein
MKRIHYALMAFISVAYFFLPDLVQAAGGGKVADLIVVAEPRAVDWSVAKFWVDQYNTDPFMFGLYCTIFTGLLGASLGLITDQIMRHTGLDLTSRKIVEH